jgi:flagellar biosynthesis regulator FlaF
MADDDRSLLESKNAPLPRCHCNWKMCRTYQRAFRDYDHEAMQGVVRFKFSEYDETHRTLKEAWDKILGTEEAKKEAWKDGTCKYYVANHHFTEAMIAKSKKAKKSWSWTETVSKDDAAQVLFKLKDENMAGDGADGYLKVPDVPKKFVKDLVETIKQTRVFRQNSISDLSVKSNMSSKGSSGKPGKPYKGKPYKGKAEQLEDLLAGLPGKDDEEDEIVSKPKSKKGSSLLTGSEDLHKSDPNLGSTGKKKKKDGLGGSTHSAKSKSKKDGLGGSTHSEKSKSKSGKSPKKHGSKGKMPRKPEDFEGELMELVDNAGENKAQEKIAKLEAELFEQKAVAEAALEDLQASKNECHNLRDDIRSMKVKVGRVSEVIEASDIDDMEKLRLSLSSTMEIHNRKERLANSKWSE